MVILLSLLVTTVAYGSRVTDCPCVPPRTCRTTPYGSHALDISTFGILPPCPVLGTVRCCPRDGTEKKLTALNLIEQLSNLAVDTNNMDVECDCVQQGICLEHFVKAKSDCSEFEELCCIPNSDVNAAVQLFIDELEDYGDNENTDALSMHDSTLHDEGIVVNDNTAISHSEPEELQDDTEEDEAVPCVPGLMCAKLYGFHPLDIAKFGVLPHCPRRGLVRCVELKAPGSSQPHLFTHEEGYHDAYILPCVLLYKCDKIYGFDPLDIAKFGVLPHCARRGFARCIQVKDTTSNTSPPVISEMSSSASPSVASNIQDQSSSTSPSLTSLIISDIEAQLSSTGNYQQTDENGNRDFSSSDMQDVSDGGNFNIDERAEIVDLMPIKMTEFTPIALDGNNVISEVANLQVLIPTELIGTDIHRLIKKHLALKVSSNSLPVSTEIRHNSVDLDIVSVIAQVIKNNERIKHDSVQDPSKFVKPDNKKDESSHDKFEIESFTDIVPNQNVKDPENNEN